MEKVYNDRITEAEKNGKVSQSEKSKIYDEVLEQMEQGDISTDTIEAVLGEEALSQYDSLSKEADEFKTLYETKSSELSKKQQDRLAELEARNKEKAYDIALKDARSQISRDVSEMVKEDRLSESYNQRSLRGQAYQADVRQYKSEAARKTVQKAMDSGILNNTRRSHEFVDLVAKLAADKGIEFDFANNAKIKETGFALQDATVNGYVTDNGVTVNIDSAKALNSVVGHEITHVLEGTELYGALQKTITEYARSKGDYDARLAALTKLYRGKAGYTGKGSVERIHREVVADLVGDYLFTDTDFVRRLSTENRGVFQKIFDEVKYLCRVATAGSKEARQLEKVKKAFEEAYRTETKNPTDSGGVKYSLQAFEDGTRFVDVQMAADTFDGMTVAEMNRTAKAILMEKFAGKVIGLDNRAFVNGDSVNEYLHPSKSIDTDIRKAKLTAAGELDNLLDAGTPLPNEPDGKDGHVHPDVIDFSYYKTIFKVGEEYFEGIVNIKNIKKGKLLKDITKIRNITKDIVSSYGQNPKSNFLRDASMISISNDAENVNTKNSLSEVGQTFPDDFAPLPGNYYGKDVALEQAFPDDFAPLPPGHQGQMANVDNRNNSRVDTNQVLDYDNTISETKGEEAGNERREETRDAFLGRAGEALLEVEERGALAFGYRRYPGQLSENIQTAEEGLKEIGIPVVVFEQLEGNKEGVTTIYRNDASALPGMAVFIQKDATVDAMEIVGHEGYHYLAASDNRVSYEEVLMENVDFASEAFINYQQKYVGDIYFADDVEIGSKEWTTLMEEIFAYITGDIHAGDPKGEVHKFLRDYDAVKAAWETLISKQKGNTAIKEASDDSGAFSIARGKDKAAAVAEFPDDFAPLPEGYGQGATTPQSPLGSGDSSPARGSKMDVRADNSTGAAPAGFDPVSNLQYQYGSLPEGEKAVREDSLPKSTDGKTKVSLTARSVKGAEATPDGLVDLLDKTVVEGGLSYLPIKNDATVSKVYEEIDENGWEISADQVRRKYRHPQYGLDESQAFRAAAGTRYSRHTPLIR